MDSNTKWYKIDSYSMKCRLYPNKENAKKIDDAIMGVQIFYNCTLYEIFNTFCCTTEKYGKDKSGNITDRKIHFLRAGDIGKAERKNRLVKEHPIIDCAPAGAISSSVYGISCDIKKSIGTKPIEFNKPRFYNKKYPRRSYSYQETFGKITVKDNRKVLYINLAKIGTCKIRGWNQKIRFDSDGKMNFLEYIERNRNKQVGVIVSKDNCGDYWIVFKLADVYKLCKSADGLSEVGVDAGIRHVANCSNGDKYENKRFKKENKRKLKLLNRKLSRRFGFANEKFRDLHKENKTIVPSKGYERTKLKLAKLQRKIARKRENENHLISRRIVESSSFVAVETLNVSGMFRNRHLAFALSDAAIGQLLSMLSYKSNWYGRVIQPIDRWTPSTKRCHCCGFIKKDITLSVEEWMCPSCGTHHDRDINAAKNILYFALKELEQKAAKKKI